MEPNILRKQWIKGQLVRVDNLGGVAFTGESDAHTFLVSGIDQSGAEVPITGTISGKLLNSARVQVPLSGSVSGGVASITMSRECYAVPGSFVLSVYVTTGNTSVCIYCGCGTINNTSGTSVAYPTAGLPDLVELISEVQDIINSIPPDYSALVEQIHYSDGVRTITAFTNGKYIATSGTTANINNLVSNSKLKVAVIACTEGDIFSVSGTGSSAGRLWAFLKTDGTVISKSNASVTETGMLLVAPPESAYLVVNANIDYSSAVYSGYAMQSRLTDTINSEAVADEIVFDDFVSGYWVDGNGAISPTSAYKMSRGFIRVLPGEYYISDQSEGYLRLVCYDADMKFLGKTTLYTPDHPSIQPILAGTKWARLTVATQESNPDSVTIRRIDGRNAKLIQYPSVDDGVLVLANTTMTASGTIQTGTSGYHLAIIPHIQGKTIYTSYNGTNACIFKDDSGTVMTREAPTSCVPIGTLNPIPDGAHIAFVNLKVTSEGEGEWYSVILKEGYKKVLVIGDSVTWLDGRTGTKFAGTMKGFQAQIRKAGYLVDSMGYSGRPYAEYSGSAESETDDETFEDSIYKRIVTDRADVSGYDYIILFGGHNDIRLNSENPQWCPLGTAPTTYEEMRQPFDSTTFYGALCAIIKYCRDNNQTAQIIQWTVTQTESTTRPYLKTKEYRDAEIAMSLFWDIPYIDMFSVLNFTPFINYKSESDTGATGFHYDTSHPNYIGMERLGKIGLKALQMYD